MPHYFKSALRTGIVVGFVTMLGARAATGSLMNPLASVPCLLPDNPYLLLSIFSIRKVSNLKFGNKCVRVCAHVHVLAPASKYLLTLE